jgi:hypothetical protein
MITPTRERVRKSRGRKRLGKTPCQVIVTEQEVDYLRRRGCSVRPGDKSSIGDAVSSLLADLVLEATA